MSAAVLGPGDAIKKEIVVWCFLALSSLGFGVGCVLLTIEPGIALICGFLVLVCSAFLAVGAMVIEDAISFVASFILAGAIVSCMLLVDILDLQDFAIRNYVSLWLAPVQMLIAAICLQSMDRFNLEWSRRGTGIANLLAATAVAAIMFTTLGRTRLIDAPPLGWLNYMILTLHSVVLSNRLVPFLVDWCKAIWLIQQQDGA